MAMVVNVKIDQPWILWLLIKWQPGGKLPMPSRSSILVGQQSFLKSFLSEKYSCLLSAKLTPLLEALAASVAQASLQLDRLASISLSLAPRLKWNLLRKSKQLWQELQWSTSCFAAYVVLAWATLEEWFQNWENQWVALKKVKTYLNLVWQMIKRTKYTRDALLAQAIWNTPILLFVWLEYIFCPVYVPLVLGR